MLHAHSLMDQWVTSTACNQLPNEKKFKCSYSATTDFFFSLATWRLQSHRSQCNCSKATCFQPALPNLWIQHIGVLQLNIQNIFSAVSLQSTFKSPQPIFHGTNGCCTLDRQRVTSSTLLSNEETTFSCSLNHKDHKGFVCLPRIKPGMFRMPGKCVHYHTLRHLAT